MSDKQPTTIGSVAKALSILQLLARDGALGLTEISTRLGLNFSTAHHLISTLRQQRFIDQEPGSKRYRLGVACFELGHAAATQLDLRTHAMPYLEQLAATLGETANVAVLDEGAIIYVAQAAPARMMKTFVAMGARVPAHCSGVGKALLASLPEPEIDAIIDRHGLARFTAMTLTNAAQLKSELTRIREQGYAVDNQEREDGVICVAAPVRDYTDQVIAAISISGPRERMGDKDWDPLIATLKSTAADLSHSLGYRCNSQTAQR